MAIELQIVVSDNIIKFNKTYSIMPIISWVNNYFKYWKCINTKYKNIINICSVDKTYKTIYNIGRRYY